MASGTVPKYSIRRSGISKATVFLMLGALLLGQPVRADDFDWSSAGLAAAGKDYTNWDLLPSGDARARANMYYMFVIGVAHTFFYERRLCAASIKGAQIATIVSKYLNDHPERWQSPPAQLIYEALAPTYRCTSKQK